MTFQVVRAAAFEQDLDDFAAYTTAYSGEFSREQFTRLNHVLTVELASAPAMWGLFFITGAPYRVSLSQSVNSSFDLDGSPIPP